MVSRMQSKVTLIFKRPNNDNISDKCISLTRKENSIGSYRVCRVWQLIFSYHDGSKIQNHFMGQILNYMGCSKAHDYLAQELLIMFLR